MPWKGGKILVRNITCPDTMASSQRGWFRGPRGRIQEGSEVFPPFSCTFLYPNRCGDDGPDARNFFRELARRIKSVTDDDMTHQYLVQRVSVIIQRGNAAAVLGCIGEGSVV